MTEKALCFWVRCAIVAMAICGVCVCIFWYPYSVSLTTEKIQGAKTAAYWLQLTFYWLISLPCFAILFIGWKITTEMKSGSLFLETNAKAVKTAVQILFTDIAVFLIGNVIFLFLGWNVFAFVYLFIAVIGLIIGVFMAILSHYLYKAAELQEECEGTI